MTAIYVASMLTGACHFGREAAEALVRERKVGIEALMTIAAVVATIMGAAGEGAMLAFLYSISEAAEGDTEAKTRSAVRALRDLAPQVALVRRDGGEVEVPVQEIAAGDVFIVRPGQSVPTDGEVLAGASSVDQAPVTGESVPVEKGPGQTVFAGSINGEGALAVRATRAFAENTSPRPRDPVPAGHRRALRAPGRLRAPLPGAGRDGGCVVLEAAPPALATALAARSGRRASRREAAPHRRLDSPPVVIHCFGVVDRLSDATLLISASLLAGLAAGCSEPAPPPPMEVADLSTPDLAADEPDLAPPALTGPALLRDTGLYADFASRRTPCARQGRRRKDCVGGGGRNVASTA